MGIGGRVCGWGLWGGRFVSVSWGGVLFAHRGRGRSLYVWVCGVRKVRKEEGGEEENCKKGGIACPLIWSCIG